MTNSINISEAKPSNIIVLTFDESELEGIYQSDEYDYSPKNMTVDFDVNFIDKAKKLFRLDPDLFAAKYRTNISSNNYGGKIEADLVQIFMLNDQQLIYACFSNGYTGTSYELNITDKVLEALKNNNSTA